MRLVGRALALCVLGMWGAALAAPDAKPSLVVFDLEPRGASALEAQGATLGVVRGLRELDVFQVLSSEDLRQLLAVERSRQLFGGASSGVDLAKPLGARHMVVGTVAKSAAGLQVECRLLDTQSSTVVSQKAVGPLKGMEALASELPVLAQQLVAPLLAAEQGALLVHAKEEGAEVLLDGVLVASTPMKAPVKAPRGSHRLQVRKDGFIALARTVQLTADQLKVEEVTLVPSADYAEAYRKRHGRLRVGAYLATVAAVAGVGGAVLLDRAVTEPTYRREFLPRQIALRGELLPDALAGDFSAELTRQQCVASAEACREQMKQLEGALRLQQVATWSLALVGAAAAGTATYLWLTGEDPNRYTGLVAGVSVGERTVVAVTGRF